MISTFTAIPSIEERKEERDSMSLDSFFSPKSVAVVGASREKGKVGYEILASLIDGGFEGDIYPVNPKADEIDGLMMKINQAKDLLLDKG